MAEPFAAAVLQEEQAANQLPDPRIRASTYKPAWEAAPQTNRGEEQRVEAQRMADSSLARDISEAPDTFSRSFRSGGNIGYQIYKQIDRAYQSGPVDDMWRNGDNKKWVDENRKRIPETDDWRFTGTRNREEAESLLKDKELWAKDAEVLKHRTGVIPTVAWLLPGVVDIDAPLTLATGGLTSTALRGITANRLGQLMTGAATGGIAGGALGAGSYLADPNSDWTAIPLAGLAGIGFGTLGGAFARTGAAANKAAKNTINELGESMADGMPRATKENIQTEAFETADHYGTLATQQAERELAEQEAALAKEAAKASPEPTSRAPAAIKLEDLDTGVPDVEPRVFQAGETSGDAGSIGARSMNTNGPGVAAIRSTRIQDMIQNSRTRVQQLGLATDWLDGWRNVPQYAEGVTRQVERFHNFVAHTALGSDFARMMNTGSSVAQSVAYDLMENATGIIRNGRSAARVMEHYQKQLLSKFTPFDDSFNAWATDNGAGTWRRIMDPDLRAQFNREVTAELQARYHDGQGLPNQNARIKAAADAIDNTFANEVAVVQGRANEIGVKGTDQLKQQAGYMPQKWLGRNLKRMIETGVKRDDIRNAIAEGYLAKHPHMKPKDAKIYSDAVVDFAMRSDEGINTNLIGMLTGDGRQEFEEIFRRNGFSEAEINARITAIKGTLESRGAPGWSKGRLDIDLRFTASNGIKIMDLVDTDFQSMVPARVRRSAGQAALARKGIASRADWEDIKSAILQEQTARGQSVGTGGSIAERASDFVNSDRHVDREFLDGIYSYFNGTPIAGGVSPIYSRMKKLTNLALLNQLGLTQIAELGPTIASVGIESFFRHAGEAVSGALRKPDSPLVQELKHMSILVPEEKLFRADLVHEFEKTTTQNEWYRNFDRILNKAQHIQGYTSGFNAMRNFQQRIAVSSAADKLARHFRDGNLISPERMRDMGLDGADVAKLKTYVQNGTVQFDAQGNLVKLNMDKWAPEDADLFAMTLNQRTNTLVQKAMAGESSMMFHKDGLAQLFFHLKSFPMLALEKQALRNSRMLDMESAMTFMYGLGTAAAAYTVRQTVNGRTENLEWSKIANGAFGYSNMTGWIPMWTDPLAAMLGMDSLMFGGYGGKVDVISPLASVETLNRIAKIPGAVLSGGDLSLSNSDINALSAVPLIGNAYGFAYIFNAMRKDNTEKKEQQRKAQRTKETEQVAVQASATGGFVQPLADALGQ